MKNPSPIKRRKPIRRVSAKRAVQLREYSKLRKQFLDENPVCGVWLDENGWHRVLPFRRAYAPLGAGRKLFSAEHLFELGAPQATEVHHRAKRRGAMLNDTSKWLAVCRSNHERIENGKSWARANGYLENI